MKPFPSSFLFLINLTDVMSKISKLCSFETNLTHPKCFDIESVKAKMENCLKVFFILLAIDHKLMGKYQSLLI